MPLVERGDRRRVHVKKLAPVRAHMERRQRLLDLGCDALDRVLLSLPGEVERHAVLPVVHAHPQLVGGDGADLGDKQERLDAAREPPDGCEGLNGVPARKEVLRLDLFAAARREPHPEVWDAVRPGTGPAQLRGAGGGIHHAGRMHLGGRRHRAEKISLHAVGFIRAALDPDLFHDLTPVGEEAHAVGDRGDLLEVLLDRVPAQPLVHALLDLVGRLHVKGDPRDHAECPQPDHHAIEVRIAPRHPHDLATGCDQLQPGNGGGQVAMPHARTVRSGRNRAGNRDVG